MDAARLIEKLFPRGRGGGEKPVERIIVGLGNPGPEYRNTRHNVGWWVLDDIAGRVGASFRTSGADGEEARTEIGSHEVLLVRPLTYMNRSGDAVRRVLRKNNVPAEQMLTIYDDLNLTPGKVRIRSKGGAGGHNGMKSVIAALGTEDFPRIRVGIGSPGVSSGKVDFVLGTMAPEERKTIEAAAARAADAAADWVSLGIEATMNRYNG